MSVGFGFSVTDFIGAVKLVGTVIDALSASSTDSSELQELYQQLRNLETILRNIEQLEVDDSLHADVVALKQSAAQCQSTITNFLCKTQPYEAHLLCTNGGTRNVHSEWKKVKWALCKRKHVIQFKIDLSVHVQYIQLPLSMIQMKHLELGQKRQQDTQKSFVSQFQHTCRSGMRELSVISKTLTSVTALAQKCANNSRRIRVRVIPAQKMAPHDNLYGGTQSSQHALFVACAYAGCFAVFQSQVMLQEHSKVHLPALESMRIDPPFAQTIFNDASKRDFTPISLPSDSSIGLSQYRTTTPQYSNIPYWPDQVAQIVPEFPPAHPKIEP
ncbi:MAG: hypothetical protein Q9178_000032 [Gyalolechia marmorata]